MTALDLLLLILLAGAAIYAWWLHDRRGTEAAHHRRETDELRQHHLIADADPVQWDFAHSQLKARARLRCATVQGAINAAVQGAGLVRCLNYPVHEHLASGRLRRVLPGFEPPAVPVQVVYREGRHASMRVRSFVDECVTALRGHPAFQLA